MLVDNAQDVLGALILEALAGLGAGDFFLLAEEGAHAVLLVIIHAGVKPHGRDAGIGSLLGHRPDRTRVGHGHGDAIHAGVDGGLHQVCLVGRFRIGGIAQLDIVLAGGILRALAHEVPVGIPRRAVGDHGDDKALGVDATG